MIRLRGLRYLEKTSKRVSVSSLERKIALIAVSPRDYGHKSSDHVLIKDGPSENAIGNGLSLLSVRNTNGVYPDTAESGEAYDAEASLEAD